MCDLERKKKRDDEEEADLQKKKMRRDGQRLLLNGTRAVRRDRAKKRRLTRGSI